MPGAARPAKASQIAPIDARHALGVMAPEAATAEDVLAELSTTVAGLSATEAASRRMRYGRNLLPGGKRAAILTVLFHQFQSAVVYLLAAAAALAAYFGEIEEAGAIGIVLLINTTIGFATEIRAVRSIEALRKLEIHSARVRRDGFTQVVPAADLVPGDIVVLEAGDLVPADLRVIEAARLAVDESTLTGESVAVGKSPSAVKAGARLGDRTSIAFKGTAITGGNGTGVVIATGPLTELGRIAQLTAAAEPDPSPLERQLSRLSNQLLWATLALAVILIAIGLAAGKEPFLLVEAAIALAVAAVPEGLPIVATLALARGMWRMVRRNALVERLPAVETLGATTVILTDKTGTLTENRMTVRRLWLASGELDLSAAGSESDDPVLRRLFRTAVFCNTASLGAGSGADSGDAMELALLRAGRAILDPIDDLLAEHPRVYLHPFDVGTRMMATVHDRRDGGSFDYEIKGAPEAVISCACRIATNAGDLPLGEEARARWLWRADELGRRGLRVLACATKSSEVADAPPFNDLVLLGLVGLEDPARVDVPDAIRACQEAGIRVTMVTGDHAVTARSIAMAVGLGGSSPRIVEGAELEAIAARGDGALFTADIFARVNPAEKLELVRAYQANGEIVAMTGDGVNDAPALRQADIGVAMGLHGTDVARQAAAMVLLDDAFPTIVGAIREGRIIFGNIRRFVAYLLSCNLSEVLVVGAALLTTLPLPILPLQILFLNMLTDIFPAFALALGEGEDDVMRRPPRDPARPMLGRGDWARIALQAAIMAAATFCAMVVALTAGFDPQAVTTATFLTLAGAQLWHVFNMHGARSRLLVNPVTTNRWVWAALGLCVGLMAVASYWPPLTTVLGLRQPDLGTWAIVLPLSLAPTMLMQAVMVLKGWRKNATA